MDNEQNTYGAIAIAVLAFVVGNMEKVVSKVFISPMIMVADGGFARVQVWTEANENKVATVNKWLIALAQAIWSGEWPTFANYKGDAIEVDADYLNEGGKGSVSQTVRANFPAKMPTTIEQAVAMLSLVAKVNKHTGNVTVLGHYLSKLNKSIGSQDPDYQTKAQKKAAKQADSAGAPDAGADTGLYAALRADGLSPQEAIAQMKQLR